MKVFISWSGETSRAIAQVLYEWLPAVLQAVKPYFTEDDISKGTRWNTVIAKQLEECKVGLICLTSSNFKAPWIMFEAGALAKNLNDSKVCPILFGFDATEMTGPLVQFQGTHFNKSDIKKVIKTINGELGDSSLSDNVLGQVFDMWWPKLEKQVSLILRSIPDHCEPVKRSERELLEEMLTLIRKQAFVTNIPYQAHSVQQSPCYSFGYTDEEVDTFSRNTFDYSANDDPNSSKWFTSTSKETVSRIDGEWHGRWNGGSAGNEWREGEASIRTINDIVYILINDGERPYLIVARMDGTARLVGRYFRIDHRKDTTPWVGYIISDDRIDGLWLQGRWDFRRG